MGALYQLAFGCVFGIVLTRTGASDFDAMVRMFRFEDAHLFALAGVTTAAAALGLWALLRSRWGAGVRVVARRVHPGSIPGGVAFGIGWGLSGSCPGTALAQLGSGHLVAGFTVAGVVLGNLLFERFGRKVGAPADVCS